MILTTDELKRAVDKLEDGKFIFVGSDDKYDKDFPIEKIIRKSSHKDDPLVWHYVLCIGKEY